jgi:hypothetical protein
MLSHRAVASDNVLVRELSGEAVLLNLDNEMYFGLDEVGFRMWTVLTTSESISAAYEQLLAEYEVAPAELMQTLDDLISKCTQERLLNITRLGEP